MIHQEKEFTALLHKLVIFLQPSLGLLEQSWNMNIDVTFKRVPLLQLLQYYCIGWTNFSKIHISTPSSVKKFSKFHPPMRTVEAKIDPP